MSREREVLTTSGEKPFTEEDREKHLARQKEKARLTALLERGLVRDRLAVDLPPDLYGEWVPNDPAEIERKRILGFEIDTKYATARATHNDGSGAAIIGDTVFMTCPREQKELLDEISRERYNEIHNPKRGREEKEYAANARDKDGHIPTFTTSAAQQANIQDVKAAVDAASRMSTPAVK